MTANPASAPLLVPPAAGTEGTAREGAAPAVAAFDLDAAWDIHPQVAVRPEPFGALLYHFGTRRLSFLKDPVLLTVVRELPNQASAGAALAVAGIAAEQRRKYARALATLAATDMILIRPDREDA